jgi:small-conductance mechanosensitive channel
MKSKSMEALSEVKRRRGQRWTFAGLVLFSAFFIGDLFYNPPTFSTLTDWITLGGAILFPIMAIISFFAMRSNWSDEQTDRITMRTLGLVLLAPVALIVALLVGYAAFGWLATIPSWAALSFDFLTIVVIVNALATFVLWSERRPEKIKKKFRKKLYEK